MELFKNEYYEATVDGHVTELAIRSDFKGDYGANDFCICQTRDREEGRTITRYKVMNAQELRKALKMSPRAKLEIRSYNDRN